MTPWKPCLLCGEMIWGAAICVTHPVIAKTGERQPIAEMGVAPYLCPELRSGPNPYATGKRWTRGEPGLECSGGLPSLGKRRP